MIESALVLLLVISLGGGVFSGARAFAVGQGKDMPTLELYAAAAALGWMLPYVLVGGLPVEEDSFGIALAVCGLAGVYVARKDRKR